uniref:Uncharacterized protein n=1 Tax=Phaseolus vulgaris TaxID=3885 RepID=V7BD40_PHAVU|nr:hypothetical protein PHAVU_008G277400g [Phaseolus vulgaris]ESW14396.1 hypothetical protein PHAVU_008G277400g [Phaseolus vulgaris]
MAFQPKAEPGSLAKSLPRLISTALAKGYSEMSISELVSVLRVAYQTEDFDKVEEELVKREAKLTAEIGPLRAEVGPLRAEVGILGEKIHMASLNRIEAEERLKSIEEQCEKGKRSQEHYEQLLKEVKKNGLLKEFKKKMIDDAKSVAELTAKIPVLEEEKARDKSTLDSLKIKNMELEEAVKKNLTVIEGLRTENCRLTDEKHKSKTSFESLERKYSELSASVVRLEDDIKLLLSGDASNCGNTEVEPNPGVSYAVKDEQVIDDYELENDNGEPVPFQRTKDTRHSLDAATAHTSKKGNKEDALPASEKEIIDLSDDDDDGCKYQGLHREKAISQTIGENEHAQRVETIKRKHASDIEISTCTEG